MGCARTIKIRANGMEQSRRTIRRDKNESVVRCSMKTKLWIIFVHRRHVECVVTSAFMGQEWPHCAARSRVKKQSGGQSCVNPLRHATVGVPLVGRPRLTSPRHSRGPAATLAIPRKAVSIIRMSRIKYFAYVPPDRVKILEDARYAAPDAAPHARPNGIRFHFDAYYRTSSAHVVLRHAVAENRNRGRAGNGSAKRIGARVWRI